MSKSANMSGKDRGEWKKEFDRRVKEGRQTKRMGFLGEKQVEDDHGNWYRRNGDACCGCGHHQQAGPDVTKKEHEQKPRWRRR